MPIDHLLQDRLCFRQMRGGIGGVQLYRQVSMIGAKTDPRPGSIRITLERDAYTDLLADLRSGDRKLR